MTEIEPQIQDVYNVYKPIAAKLTIDKRSGGPMTNVFFDIDLGNSWMLSGTSSGLIDLDVKYFELILEISSIRRTNSHTIDTGSYTSP